MKHQRTISILICIFISCFSAYSKNNIKLQSGHFMVLGNDFWNYLYFGIFNIEGSLDLINNNIYLGPSLSYSLFKSDEFYNYFVNYYSLGIKFGYSITNSKAVITPELSSGIGYLFNSKLNGGFSLRSAVSLDLLFNIFNNGIAVGPFGRYEYVLRFVDSSNVAPWITMVSYGISVRF